MFETDLAKRPLIRSFYRELAKRPLVEILRRDVHRDLLRSCQDVPDKDLATRALLDSCYGDLKKEILL